MVVAALPPTLGGRDRALEACPGQSSLGEDTAYWEQWGQVDREKGTRFGIFCILRRENKLSLQQVKLNGKKQPTP